MTDNQVTYAKILRQKIMASVSMQGFSSEEFHELLEEWGYGNSLRKLRIAELKEVRALVNGWECEKKKYGLGQLDEQGKYAWSLMLKAGWTWERLQNLLLKKFKATHWNALTQNEKRATINILRRYQPTSTTQNPSRDQDNNKGSRPLVQELDSSFAPNRLEIVSTSEADSYSTKRTN